MPRNLKDPFEGLRIPEPGTDFEKRILAAGAKARAGKNVIPFRNPGRALWGRATAAAGLAACFALLWLMPTPADRVHGVPILADISFGEEDFLSPSGHDAALEDLF
jgi:hypothetical protein